MGQPVGTDSARSQTAGTVPPGTLDVPRRQLEFLHALVTAIGAGAACGPAFSPFINALLAVLTPLARFMDAQREAGAV